MELHQYLNILKRGWWIIVAMMLAISGLGIFYSYSQTPIYESTSNFVVNPTLRMNETGDMLYSLDTLASRTTLATTYANILSSRTTVETAATTLGVSSDVLENYTVLAVVLPDSNIIQLAVDGPSPDLAADLANRIGKTGQQNIRNLQEIYELRLVDTAIPNDEPISPNHPIDIILSMMVGIAGGLAFVTLREILTQTLEQSYTSVATIEQPVLPISPLDPIPTPIQKTVTPSFESIPQNGKPQKLKKKKKSKKKKSDKARLSRRKIAEILKDLL